MSILTVNIGKGGTGKTTFVFTYGSQLALMENKKTLLIDADESMNLSTRFKIEVKPENRIDRIFSKEKLEIKPIELSNNLDLIAGSSKVEELNKELLLRSNNQLIMAMWFADNYDWLKEYDYIIIDTHNDNQFVTQNAFVISDLVLGVSDPSKDGFEALMKLRTNLDILKSDVINPIDRVSYVKAAYRFIGNYVPYNTSSAKEFISSLSEDPEYLGFIHRREILNQANIAQHSIIASYLEGNIERKHNDFLEELFSLFNKITDELDKQGEINNE